MSKGHSKQRCQHERSRRNCDGDRALGTSANSVCTGPERQGCRRGKWQEVRWVAFVGNTLQRALNAGPLEDVSPATSGPLFGLSCCPFSS